MKRFIIFLIFATALIIGIVFIIRIQEKDTAAVKIVAGEKGQEKIKIKEDEIQPATIEYAKYKDLVTLASPLPEQKIDNPLIVTGWARGTWFFEGSFPVTLTNWDGLIIAEGAAQAQIDPSDEHGAGWMTEDFVPFRVELKYETPSLYDRGSLILKKDNPSGLPEHDDAYEITVFFKEIKDPAK